MLALNRVPSVARFVRHVVRREQARGAGRGLVNLCLPPQEIFIQQLGKGGLGLLVRVWPGVLVGVHRLLEGTA